MQLECSPEVGKWRGWADWQLTISSVFALSTNRRRVDEGLWALPMLHDRQGRILDRPKSPFSFPDPLPLFDARHQLFCSLLGQATVRRPDGLG
jgi:hypothetical protein